MILSKSLEAEGTLQCHDLEAILSECDMSLNPICWSHVLLKPILQPLLALCALIYNSAYFPFISGQSTDHAVDPRRLRSLSPQCPADDKADARVREG